MEKKEEHFALEIQPIYESSFFQTYAMCNKGKMILVLFLAFFEIQTVFGTFLGTVAKKRKAQQVHSIYLHFSKQTKKIQVS